MSEIKKYYDSNGVLMAIVIPSDFKTNGIDFLTKDEDLQQLGVMSHPANHVILPHYHNMIERKVGYTTETLVIRKGVLEVCLFENKELVHKFNIKTGDILTLLSGGHGFTVKEEVDMVEIKQGPYVGEGDKTRF